MAETETETVTEGWGFPGLSRKAHYFTGGLALCRKWAFTGRLEADNGKPSPDDCAACRKHLASRASGLPSSAADHSAGTEKDRP